MPDQADINSKAINDPQVRLAISKMVLAVLVDRTGTTGMNDLNDRIIYFAALEGTVLGRKLTKAKLSEATGIPRSTIKRHLERLVSDGALVYFKSSGTFAVNAAYANSPEIMARNATLRRVIVQCHDIISGGAGGQNGQSEPLQDVKDALHSSGRTRTKNVE